MSVLRHPDWHFLSGQKFRRRAAVRTSHQIFRGESYLVLTDRLSGQSLRLAERARDVWQRLDGRRSAQEIWEDLMRRPATAPGQGELVEWLLQLVGAGMVLSDYDLDPESLSHRSRQRVSAAIEQRAASPLAIKAKLFDPSPFVRATFPLVRPIFTVAGAVAFVLLLLVAGTLAVLNWEGLTRSTDARLLSQSNVLLLLLVYPFMKAVHELTHCYALYRFGGEVRELGVMFLLFFPVPYVDASEASALPHKSQRMLVGAGGILAELTMSALAMIAWAMIEPGLERAVLFNLMLVGTVSTLLFNGNPLLKFDAYYVVSDWLEIPNLATRSGEYLSDRMISRCLGLRPEIAVTPGEARMFALYGPLSLAYRLSLTLTIAWVVSTWFFVLGALLAGWAVISGLLWPFAKTLRKGHRMAKSQNRSRSAGLRALLLVSALLAAAVLVPLPFAAPGEGQILVRPEARITSASSGVVAGAPLSDGAQVDAETVLLTLDNPAQGARAEALRSRVDYLEEALALSDVNVIERQRLERELELARSSLAELETLEEGRRLRAPLDGVLNWDGGRPPAPGAYVSRGDFLGRVTAPGAMEVVLSFPAAYAGLSDAETRPDVELLMPDGRSLTGEVLQSRIVDVGGQVPPELLASSGGSVPAMPGEEARTLAALWIVRTAPEADLTRYAGARVTARLDFGTASLARQLQFHLQRLFLRATRF